MQLASRIWFCWQWLAGGKDAQGAVQHLLAFVGLSQDIAFDSSDSSDGDMNINQDRLNVAG